MLFPAGTNPMKKSSGMLLGLLLGITAVADIPEITWDETAVPVVWSGNATQPDFHLAASRLRYRHHGDEEDRETDEHYLVAWLYHHQDETYFPVIADRLDGHSPTIMLDDLNADGQHEIIVAYHTGAHTQAWKIYGRMPRHEDVLPFKPIGEFRSDLGKIEILTSRVNGYAQIATRNTDGDHREQEIVETYSFADGRYALAVALPGPMPVPRSLVVLTLIAGLAACLAAWRLARKKPAR
jgi:hypothetical protein